MRTFLATVAIGAFTVLSVLAATDPQLVAADVLVAVTQ